MRGLRTLHKIFTQRTHHERTHSTQAPALLAMGALIWLKTGNARTYQSSHWLLYEIKTIFFLSF